MLVKLIKTFCLISVLPCGMIVILFVIYGLLRFFFGIQDCEDLPYGLENDCDTAFEILLLLVGISGSITISLIMIWVIKTAFYSIWSS